MSQDCNCEAKNKYTGILGYRDKVFIDHLDKREILLNEEIDDDLVEKVIMNIIRWNQEDDELGLEGSERSEIVIYLNTPGGQVDIGLGLCSVIQNSKTKVKVVILGLAASMGGLIAIAGHETVAYKYTNVLLHDGSMLVGGSTNKIKDTIKFQDEKEEQIKELVTTNTNITSDKYDEMQDREWWMSAETAKELGIVQKVL